MPDHASRVGAAAVGAFESDRAEGAAPGRRVSGRLAAMLCVAGLSVLLSEVSLRSILGVQPLSEARAIYRAHPRWGWHHEPNASDDFVKLGTRQRISIGPTGLRSGPIPYERTPGTMRVLVLGDSIVAGLEVAVESLWTTVAERALRARGLSVEIVNAGVRGWGTDQSLLFLADEGVRYRPELVLYFWNQNDIDDNQTAHRAFRAFGKPWFDVDAEDRLILRGVPVPEYPYAANRRIGEDGAEREVPVAAHVPVALWARDHLVMTTAFGTGLVHIAAAMPQLTRTVVGMGSYRAPQGVPGEVDRSSRIFRATAAMVHQMGTLSEGIGAQFRMLGARGRWPEALLDATGLGSLEELPLYDVRVAPGDRVFVPMDTHWNELGHDAYGNALAERLVASGLLVAARP